MGAGSARPAASPFLRSWAPVILLMTVIFALSAQSDVPMPDNMSDVSAHSLAYAALAFLILRALSGGFPARVTLRAALAAVALTVAYGVTDEIHQMFVPGRTAELRDLRSDAVGAVCAVAACWACGILWVRPDV
jgi:VanZ family protein